MTNQKYKNLTLREFDAAAEKFDDSDPSVCTTCAARITPTCWRSF